MTRVVRSVGRVREDRHTLSDMLHVGLTGGIGSGKSTVSARLRELGAVVVDADAIAREVVEPGMPALAAVAERFGPGVLTAEGALDRPALGAIVFQDEAARRDLEAITHPAIGERTAEIVSAAAESAVVVHDVPLLVELGRAQDQALTLVVDVPEELRVERLVTLRGMDEGAARARMAAQATDEERRRVADVLLDNSGSVAELYARVDALWRERLLPFEENLRAGRGPDRPLTRALTEPEEGSAGDTERLLTRLRSALGEAALRVDRLGAKDGTDALVEVADVDVLDRPETLDRLARRGLVVRAGGDQDAAGRPAERQVDWVDPVRPRSARVTT